MECDLVIKNGVIVDGTGSPFFRGDVAIKGEKIAKVGRLDEFKAEKLIDAKGLVVSPGFVDIHTHAERGLLTNPQAENYVRMGVTTVIGGNCGSSAAPINMEYLNIIANRWPMPTNLIDWSTLEEFFNRVETQGAALNFASFVGFGSIRIAVMGADAWDRSPTDNEINEMKKLVAQAMKEGAFGLSTGLEYDPQSFAETWEVIELAKVVKEYGGIYATHTRSRDYLTIEAVKEAIEICEKVDIPMQISHFNARFPADGKEKWHVDLVEQARERGLDIAFDNIPLYFDEEGTRWAMGSVSGYLTNGSKYTQKGGKITLDMLKDPEVVEFLRNDLPNRQYGPVFASKRGIRNNWHRMVIIQCKKNPQYNGKNVSEIAEIRGDADPFDSAIDLLVEEGEDFAKVTCRCAYESQWGSNMVLLHPLCSVESDSFITLETGNIRSYNLFPFFIENWVKENKQLTLEEALRKCTGLPAQRMHIMDRGILRPEMYADIVIFNKNTIKGKATFEKPKQYPEGISYVIVNGNIVVDHGQQSNLLPGKILRYNKL